MAVRILINRVLPNQSGLLAMGTTCGSQSYLTRRHKRQSKFPKEDGVTRIMELSKKLQLPHLRAQNVDVHPPSDHGLMADSTGELFSTYIPLERKSPVVTIEGLRERYIGTKEYFRKIYALFTLKRKLKPFRSPDFAKFAQRKFIEVNNALQRNDKGLEMTLKDHATLMVMKQLQSEMSNPSSRPHWRFVGEIEKPRIVNVRLASFLERENMYAQVTVRLHTEQIFALKDRYERVISGDTKVARKVVEYVVYERGVNDDYGKWRICGKLAPSTTLAASL